MPSLRSLNVFVAVLCFLAFTEHIPGTTGLILHWLAAFFCALNAALAVRATT